MAPCMVLEVLEAVKQFHGEDAAKALQKEAQLFRLPQFDEPVRQDKAARLHQCMRTMWPEDAREIGALAGSRAADRIMENLLSERAKSMLAKMPRATGAWLLAKTARQSAWMFSGSGEFEVESAERFILSQNPILLGETSEVMVCDFHASLFERLFTTLIHPRLICREVTCQAKGDNACVFEFAMSPSEGEA